MKSMRNRMVILALAITVILGLLACSTTGGLISRNDPTATPTKTPKPTFTITPTPTDTPVPTDTPTPTATFTPTPEATNTPIVLTATPTEEPTETPVPTNTTAPPTATRRPATRVPATATPAPPTNTPRPQFAWRGEVTATFPNCAFTGLFGHTLDRNGGLAGNVWIHYWTDGWNGAWALSSWTEDKGQSYVGDEKNWDAYLADGPRAATWYACVVAEQNSWDCISNTMTVQTVAEPCDSTSNGIQVVRITFRQN